MHTDFSFVKAKTPPPPLKDTLHVYKIATNTNTIIMQVNICTQDVCYVTCMSSIFGLPARALFASDAIACIS